MAAVSEKARKAAVPLPGERTQGETIAYLLAALTIGAVGLYLIQDLFAPAFFALTLVVTVRPLVSWMTRHRVPRVVAATAAIALIFTFVVLLFAALAVAVAQLVDTLPQYAPKFQAIWKQVETQLNGMGVDQSAVLKQVTNVLDTSQLVMVAQSVLGQLTSASAMMGVMSMVVVFLLFDTAKIEIRTAALGVLKPGMASALVSFCEAVRSYWMVSTVFGLIVAVINAVTLWYLNVPMAITWGVVSFITNYIPNIGFVLGVVPPAPLDGAVGGAVLHGGQLRHPVPHPAQVHWGRGGAQHDDDLPVPAVLVHRHRCVGDDPGGAADPVRQGPPHRLRPALALGGDLPVRRRLAGARPR